MRLLAVIVVFLAACSTPPTEADERAAVLREARQAVEGYVAALRDGELAAADELRCEAARLPPTEREAVLAPVVAEVRRDLGDLAVDEVELVNRIDGVVHVRVELRGADGPVYPALVEEDGALRLCGASIDGAAELVASARTRDGTDVLSAATLEELVSVPPVPGFSSVPQAADAATGILQQLDGYQAGRSVQWREAGAGRTVSVAVVDLDTAEHARAAQQVLERELHDSLTELIDGLPTGTRAFRYLAGYQLLLQPPGAGPVADYVGFRWGSRVVAVYVVPLPGDADHALALATAAAVEAAARLQG